MALHPFHIAVLVDDLDAARRFYGRLLGCSEGRSADTWVDFNMFGNQFVCHLNSGEFPRESQVSAVDAEEVPVPHCGVVLPMPEWEQLAKRLTDLRTQFLLEPQVRFRGEPGEQATMFIADPCGNVLEFKAFHDPGMLFVR